MRAISFFMGVTLSVSSAAQPVVPVPEGIHSEGSGEANVCDLAAASVDDLEKMVRALPGAEVLQGTPEYRAYAYDYRVLTFTTAANRAHPAVACRHIKPNASGGSSVEMEISCFSNRENCDWLYREFEQLNARILGTSGTGG